jgi:hypothetical protein
MKIQDHLSESLETVLGLKLLNSLMRIRDPGDGNTVFRSGMNIPERHPGSITLFLTTDKKSS